AFQKFLRGAVAIMGVHDAMFRAPLIALLMQKTAAGAAAIAMKEIRPADVLKRARRVTQRLGFGDGRLGGLCRGSCPRGGRSGKGKNGEHKGSCFPRHAQTVPMPRTYSASNAAKRPAVANVKR